MPLGPITPYMSKARSKVQIRAFTKLLRWFDLSYMASWASLEQGIFGNTDILPSEGRQGQPPF
jgi:hypothetical protein